MGAFQPGEGIWNLYGGSKVASVSHHLALVESVTQGPGALAGGSGHTPCPLRLLLPDPLIQCLLCFKFPATPSPCIAKWRVSHNLRWGSPANSKI